MPDPGRQDFKDALITFQPDLVLIEFFNHPERAASLCRQIKSSLPGTCKMAFSYNNDIDKTYLELAFDAYLQKRFDISFLTSIIGKYMFQQTKC